MSGVFRGRHVCVYTMGLGLLPTDTRTAIKACIAVSSFLHLSSCEFFAPSARPLLPGRTGITPLSK